MKNNILMLISIPAFVILSCASQKKTRSSSSAYQSVIMNRTACYGGCPIYSIELRNDGKAVYKGKKFTKFTGTYTHNIGTEEAAGILNKFEQYRVDTCLNSYKVLITDQPGLTYHLEKAGTVKNISNANFGPAFLKELSAMIDEKVQVDSTWSKVSDTADTAE